MLQPLCQISQPVVAASQKVYPLLLPTLFIHTMHIKMRSHVNLSCLDSTVSEPERLSGDNVVYKPAGEGVPDMIYLGSLSNFDLIYAWAQDKCVPLVREITFENGEVSLP